MYYHFTEEKNRKTNELKILLLKMFKIGGTHSSSIKLEVYKDKTYKLYDHDILVKHGNLSHFNYLQALEISKNIVKLKHVKCPDIDTVHFDYTLESNGVTVNLGQISSACISQLSQSLFNNIKDLDSLTST